jgi:drug/metabolite transporter (DMT)-like permease
MQQHTTSTSTKIVCFVSMFAGIFAAVFAFVSRNPSTALVLGIAAIIIGGLSVVKAHRNIDDTQVATAGIFMAVVACAVALWQMYH